MGCDCIQQVNAKLADQNTMLISVIFDGTERVLLRTERIKSLRDGKKATNVPAAFCPVCGQPYALTPTNQDQENG